MKSIIKKLINKKILQSIWVIYALLSMVLVLYLSDHLLTKDLDDISDKIILDDNWDININNEHYENVNLKTFRFDSVGKGDKIIMKTTLPDTWKFEETALCIHIRQTTVDMFVNDELIYEYGHDRVSLGKTVGSGIQLINFSNDYKGRELKIVLDVTENRAFSTFDSIWLSEWNNSYRFIITENRLPLFLGSFLIVFGIAVTLISIFAVVISRKYTNILCLSIFSICIGLWTLCYHNVALIFSIPLYSISLLEYMSLLLAPIPIIAYMYTYVKQLQSRKLMQCYKFLFTVQFLLTSITIFLHTKDIVHCAELLIYFQILFAIHSFYFTYVLHKNINQNRQRRKLYSIGLLIVMSCIVYDLLRYSFNRYIGLQIFNLRGISSLGIIIFIAILILDLYNDITLKMMEEQEKAILIKRAYTDDLTQINNRGFCSEYMNKLQADDTSQYSIITFDLNGLKKANDTYGHVKGDLLIKEAANVISEAFSSSGVVGRMGGDEFIAILQTTDKNQIEALVCIFSNLIDDTNKTKTDLNLSISYGYATCDEVSEQNIEKVYQLADDRMYEYKKKYKGHG